MAFLAILMPTRLLTRATSAVDLRAASTASRPVGAAVASDLTIVAGGRGSTAVDHPDARRRDGGRVLRGCPLAAPAHASLVPLVQAGS